MASTKERENYVYIAKLAEQAERYDGLSLSSFSFFFSIIFEFSVWLLGNHGS